MSEIPTIRSGSHQSRYTLLLAHGAGAGMDSPFMQEIALTIANKGEAIGGIQVIRFDFPYMAEFTRSGKKRPPDRQPVLSQSFNDLIDRLLAEGVPQKRLFIGGKSMGGRIASMIADERQVAGVVCLGYPFHPIGKPEKLRTEHLETLVTPALICQGERDSMGRRNEVEQYTLSPSIRIQWLADGDHSFKPRKASGHTENGNRDAAATAVIGFIGEHGYPDTLNPTATPRYLSSGQKTVSIPHTQGRCLPAALPWSKQTTR